MCTSGRDGSRSGGGAAAAADAGRGLCHGEGSRAAGRGARAGTIVSSSGSDASTASSASSPEVSSRLGAAACRRMAYERRLMVVCGGGAVSCGVSDATLAGAAAGAALSNGWRCGSPADTSSCGPLVLDGRTISNGVSSEVRGADGTGRASETAGAVAATECPCSDDELLDHLGDSRSGLGDDWSRTRCYLRPRRSCLVHQAAQVAHRRTRST